MIYRYKLTYKNNESKQRQIKYFETEEKMKNYIIANKKFGLEIIKSEEVKGLDNNILENIVRDLNIDEYEIRHEFGPIKFNIIREDKKIQFTAFNWNTERYLNLCSKKYSKLEELLSEFGKVSPGKNDGLVVRLKKINDTYDTENKIYGYCRVSTKGQLENNSLEQQEKEIKSRYKEAICYEEGYTAKTVERPVFSNLRACMKKGDTLVVTKLDRLCRSTREGLEIIEELKSSGIRIHILNMGLIEDTAMGSLIITNLLAFAEFERAMIIERTQLGKAIAKTKEGFKEGRPKKYTEKQMEHALSLLSINGGDKSYKEVEEITKISKSTLIRAMRRIKS